MNMESELNSEESILFMMSELSGCHVMQLHVLSDLV